MHTCATVITATTGRDSLMKCIQSVATQGGPRLSKIQHMIFVDGKENYGKALMIMDEAKRLYGINVSDHAIFIPDAVGNDRWNGHRMCAAGTYLAEGEYVMYLDDDNILDEFHIDSCLEAIQTRKAPTAWAYSLRKIVNERGKFICNDDCESLGPDYSTVMNAHDHLVDVNCYFIEKTLAVYMSPLWYRKAREPNVMEVDRVLVKELAKFPSVCTGKYTVNYVAGSTGISVKKEFFEQGNEIMKQRYPGGFPWRK